MLLASWTKRQSGVVRLVEWVMSDVMIRKDGHHREFWPCLVWNRALPARMRRCTNSSRKILRVQHHCKLDIPIPCRSCNQTRSGSTYVDFWSAINLHASLSIHEMLGIGIVWFVQTLFSSGLPRSRSALWCWAWPRLLSMLAPQVVPRTPRLYFSHHCRPPNSHFPTTSFCVLFLLLPPLQDSSLPIPLLPLHLKPARFVQVLCIWCRYEDTVYTSDEKCGVKESKNAWTDSMGSVPMTQLFEWHRFTGRVAGRYQQPRQLAPWCLPILGSSQFWDFRRLIRLTRTGRGKFLILAIKVCQSWSYLLKAVAFCSQLKGSVFWEDIRTKESSLDSALPWRTTWQWAQPWWWATWPHPWPQPWPQPWPRPWL